jgi:hypothetical protein
MVNVGNRRSVWRRRSRWLYINDKAKDLDMTEFAPDAGIWGLQPQLGVHFDISPNLFRHTPKSATAGISKAMSTLVEKKKLRIGFIHPDLGIGELPRFLSSANASWSRAIADL